MNKTNEVLTILLIDDDQEEHFIMKKMLSGIRDAQYELHSAYDVESGLNKITNNQYHACFVDFRLGKSNGLDLLRQAIHLNPGMPFILLTGQGSHDIDIAAMEAGAMDYLNKNELTAAVLERTIRYAMECKKNEIQLKQLNLQLQYLSEYDSLTKLPNRYQFDTLLPLLVSRCGQDHQTMAVFFIDLDKFKEVNDTLGHDYGDMLLQQVAMRIKNNIRKTDYLFRLGGDEFVVIVEPAPTTEDITAQARNILNALALTFKLDDQMIELSASIGITVNNGKTRVEAADLVKEADLAMYQAKKAGRNNFKFYHPDFSKSSSDI